MILKQTETAADFELYLRREGNVFKVFDQQDSGCASYGVEIRGIRYFVKYSNKKEAIARLHLASFLHEEVAHESIPPVCQTLTTPHGFGLVHKWVDGENLYVRQTDRDKPETPYYRFKSLPINKIIRALNRVFEIHTYLEQLSYVAVDFYDGSLLYDFFTDQVYVIDLDHYEKGPFVLKEERLPGSIRFMAPEEFQKGGLIDSRTNVYTMGAAAFVFLGAGVDRDFQEWKASKGLYDVAQKAVFEDRCTRYPSISAFYKAWLAAQ
jgi:serine/threonine-protein kinase